MTMILKYAIMKSVHKKWGISMVFNEFINNRRKELNMTVDELAKKSGIPKGSLSKITSGINQNPTLSTIKSLCKALNCSLDDAVGFVLKQPDFSKSEIEHIKTYRELDFHGKKIVDLVLYEEHERCHPVIKLITRPYYSIPVSAGLGNPLDEAPEEELEIEDTAGHRKADFIVQVSGDSMKPEFNNGDKVLVQKQPTIEIGEIGIFILNGESYIKKLGVNELISLNTRYPPKKYNANDSIFCCGKVICKL